MFWSLDHQLSHNIKNMMMCLCVIRLPILLVTRNQTESGPEPGLKGR